ncbi:DUF1007 family protein [Desulfonatronovibrio hydrogenovorans]|uniref:DUF1007 family protein n=1 Tax=Desulfonatronovibrio hydrogenovorans TaxID=53245 RepID=UPI00048A612E|nr:DUF1007 family protein [Desulfonatronovibrio hydrogenovorans]
MPSIKTTQAPPVRTLFIILSGLVALVLSFKPVFSHPHVFVESELEIELDQKGIKGFWQHWSFDEYFSAWVIDEYDTDKDGQFSPEETQRLYQEAFKNLKNHGYFTRVLNNGQEIPVREIQNFSVRIENNMAVYSFFVPLNISIDSSTKDIFIAVYDESFYCQIFFPPQEVEFRGSTAEWKTSVTTQKMPELTYYFGFVTPVAVRVSIVPS